MKTNSTCPSGCRPALRILMFAVLGAVLLCTGCAGASFDGPSGYPAAPFAPSAGEGATAHFIEHANVAPRVATERFVRPRPEVEYIRCAQCR